MQIYTFYKATFFEVDEIQNKRRSNPDNNKGQFANAAALYQANRLIKA